MRQSVTNTNSIDQLSISISCEVPMCSKISIYVILSGEGYSIRNLQRN